MFKKGDMCIYGQTGVCTVEEISEKELIKGVKRLYYTLKPIYQSNNIIYAPAENGKVFMRELISKEELNRLMSEIPTLYNGALSSEDTEENYKSLIEEHTCEALITLAVKLHSKKRIAKSIKKKIGFTDEKYLKRAEDLLFGELAVVLDIAVEKVPEVLFAQITE